MTRLSLGIRIREVLDEFGNVHGDSSSDAVSGRRRPWQLRSIIHAAFKASVEERRKNKHPELWLSRLRDVGIRDSMEGAIETRSETSAPTATADKRMNAGDLPFPFRDILGGFAREIYLS